MILGRYWLDYVCTHAGERGRGYVSIRGRACGRVYVCRDEMEVQHTHKRMRMCARSFYFSAQIMTQQICGVPNVRCSVSQNHLGMRSYCCASTCADPSVADIIFQDAGSLPLRERSTHGSSQDHTNTDTEKNPKP